MAKILCITLNPAIDVTLELAQLNVGEVNRQQNSQALPAGKGINVANVLHSLGHEIVVSGFLGQDNAHLFEQHFQKNNFDNQFIMVDGDTRQNIKIAEQSGRMTDINGKGFIVHHEQKQQLIDKCIALADDVDCIVIAGSLPQQFSLDDFQQLISQLKQHHTKIAIDTSGQALKVAIESQLWLIKPNTDELEETFAKIVQSIQQQAELFQSYHIDNIVISMGEQGVNWLKKTAQQQNQYHADTAKVQVKSTVGAGDTLVAGMIHGLLTDDDNVRILRNATALASHSVTQIAFSLPSDEQWQNILNQTQVIEIKG